MASHGRRRRRYLPEELQREVLLRLPVRSALWFRRVSKGWRNIIDDASFVGFHINRCSEESSLLTVEWRRACFERSSQTLERLRDVVCLQTFQLRPINKKKRMQYRLQVPTLLREPRNERGVKVWDIVGRVQGTFMLDKRRARGEFQRPSQQFMWNPSISERRLKLVSPLPQVLHTCPCLNLGGTLDPVTGDYRFVKVFQTHNYRRSLSWLTNRPFDSIAVYSLSTNVWSTYEFQDQDWSTCFLLSPQNRISLNGVLYGIAGNDAELEIDESHMFALDLKLQPPTFASSPFSLLEQPHHSYSYTLFHNESRSNLVLITCPKAIGPPWVGSLFDLESPDADKWNWIPRTTLTATLPEQPGFKYLTTDARLIFYSSDWLNSLDLQTGEQKMLEEEEYRGVSIWPYVEDLNFVNQRII